MILCLALAAYAFDPVEEDLGGGRVDWTTLRLVAGAEGVPSSGVMVNLGTLEGDARTHLGPKILALARKVRISSTLLAADILDAGDAVADRVDDNLSSWEVFDAKYFASGGVALEGALPLQAWLRPALTTLAAGQERSAPATASVTGLVIDARGLKVLPAIAPRVLEPSGAVLYELATLSRLSAGQRSPVVYVHDPADPIAARRAGAEPVFTKAVEVKEGCDLVLSAPDASRVSALAAQAPFLLQGHVVVVVD